MLFSSESHKMINLTISCNVDYGLIRVLIFSQALWTPIAHRYGYDFMTSAFKSSFIGRESMWNQHLEFDWQVNGADSTFLSHTHWWVSDRQQHNKTSRPGPQMIRLLWNMKKEGFSLALTLIARLQMFVRIWTRTDRDEEEPRWWESVCRLWLCAMRQWRAAARGDSSLYTTGTSSHPNIFSFVPRRDY